MWSKPPNGPGGQIRRASPERARGFTLREWRRRPRLRRAGHENAGGFTLLEVVVALALSAALMTILLIGMRVGANALEAGDRRLTKLDRDLAIVQAIEGQVAGAVPRIVMVQQDQGQAPYLCFRGDSREVRFLTRVSLTHDMAQALWLATYRVVETGDGQQQMLASETPVLDRDHLQAALVGAVATGGTVSSQPASPGRRGDPAALVPAGRVESLGDPAKRILISYLRPGTPSGPSQWVAEWKPDETELPMGIRVQVWRDTYAGALTFAIPVRKVESKQVAGPNRRRSGAGAR
ncbi:MAG TPA: prepilin-type N-terminal cleavage/methylation domain-containing protein [Candidatus Acidoferrales bacterium]|nr:prepilin-type N-terminal cleavage/methylation domain-containing protein [Candidatus Acidoferrales bacterium]